MIIKQTMSNLDAFKAELLKPSVLKEGHLLKLGRSVLKFPKLKYYVLKPSGLYCFKGQQEMEEPRSFIPLDEISLSLGTVIEATSHLYCIKIADRRKLRVLACHSLEVRNSWMTAILTAIAQRLVNEPYFLRKKIGSACSSPDSEVFCGTQCQFTSPFWVSNENKRISRSEKSPVGEVPKTRWSTRQRKKSLPTSLSLDNIQSILVGGQSKPKITRKRSMQDLTRYFLGPNSNKSSNVEEDEKVQSISVKGKRRWSLFSMAASSPYQSHDSVTKQEPFYEQESRVVYDTKL